jgi:hypothetical protein
MRMVMEAARTSETSVDNYFTRQYIPEDKSEILKFGGRAKFTAMKVPRQCPLVLLIKVGWRGGKTFDCEERRDERWSRERS